MNPYDLCRRPSFKIYIVLFLAVGIFLSSKAQVKIGVKAGYNLSTLKYSGVLSLDNQKKQSGFNAGILVTIPLSNYISMQPEAVYSTQGTNYQISNADEAYHYNYLNIPVLVKYHHPIGLFAETGLQIGLLLSARNIVSGKSEDILSKSFSPDYAWVGGLGYEITDINLSFDIRYNLGLLNIAHSQVGDLTVKNSVFQMGLIYLF